MAKIPTYASDGRRLRAYSQDAIEHLERLSLVVVRRHRRTGKIQVAFFRPQDGSNPMRATANMGQRYSYREHVGDSGARVWAHRPFMQRQDIEELTGIPTDSPAELDLYFRAIFRHVALSILKTEEPKPTPPAPAKVVNIADFQRKRAVLQPVNAGGKKAA